MICRTLCHKMFLDASNRKTAKHFRGKRKGTYLLVQGREKSRNGVVSGVPAALQCCGFSLPLSSSIISAYLLASFYFFLLFDISCSHGRWQETYDWPSHTHNHGTGYRTLSWPWLKVLNPGEMMYWDLQLYQNPQVSRGHSHQKEGASLGG